MKLIVYFYYILFKNSYKLASNWISRKYCSLPFLLSSRLSYFLISCIRHVIFLNQSLIYQISFQLSLLIIRLNEFLIFMRCYTLLITLDPTNYIVINIMFLCNTQHNHLLLNNLLQNNCYLEYKYRNLLNKILINNL